MKKTKILHLFEQYLPKTEVWAYNLMCHLPDSEIHIGANHYLKHNFYNPKFKFVDNYYDGLRAYNFKIGKLSGRNILKKLIIKLAPKLMGSTPELIRDYAEAAKVDIVHAHFGEVAWYFRTVPRKMGVPFIVSFYGWDYEMLPYLHPVYEKRYEQLFQEVDCFLCEGENGADILKKKGCPAEKIKVVHLGVEVESIPFYKRKKRKATLNLLQIASFTEKKGYFYTVEAFEKALKFCPDLSLCLLGNERQRGLKNKIKNLIESKGLSKKIEIRDSIDYGRLYDFLEDFDVFIHPSHYTEKKDCEGGAPIILLDAQATGMPVIATRHCDIPEEVIHGKTGLLAEEKDIDGLVEAIGYFYNMAEPEFQQFSKNARDHVACNYDIRKTSAFVKSVYDEMLNNQ